MLQTVALLPGYFSIVSNLSSFACPEKAEQCHVNNTVSAETAVSPPW